MRGDLAVLGGTEGIEYPRIPGHEVAGRVDAVGPDVRRWSVGDRVAVGWHGGHCLACEQCRHGQFTTCADKRVTGISRDGGFAEFTWTNLELLAVGNDLCPRCSATVETELVLCEDHEDVNGPCSVCGTNFAVRLTAVCTNCIYSVGAGAAWGTLASPELLAFLFEHGLNPLAPEHPHRLDRVLNEYDEEIRSTEPFEVVFEFTVGGDSLALVVDKNLEVLEYAR